MVGIGGTATAITKQCKNIAVAKEVLTDGKLTKEANINIWDKCQFDPVRTDVWESDDLKKGMSYFGGQSFFSVIEPYKNNIPSPVNTDLAANAQTEITQTVLYNVLIKKNQTPQQALDAAQADLKSKE